MSVLSQLAGGDAEGQIPVRQWARREPGGVYVGRDRSVWLYRELPLAPVKHEDNSRRLEVGGNLHQVLAEIGETSQDIAQGLSLLSQNRRIHIFCATFDEIATAPEDSPYKLERLLDALLPSLVAGKTLLVGVRLRSALVANMTKERTSWKEKLKSMAQSAKESHEMGLSAFDADFALMDAVFRRYGAQVPRESALAQLESWFTLGKTPDAVVETASDHMFVPATGTSYQLHSVMELPQIMHAPQSQWLLDAMTHVSGVKAVSIRAALEPPTVTRTRLRRQRRKLIAQDEEEQATGDLGRDEESSLMDYAQRVEQFVTSNSEAWMAETSIVLAHEVDEADSTFAHMLRSQYGVKTQPLHERMLEGLREMQPTARDVVNPFKQEVNVGYVAYGGLGGFSALGDKSGLFTGFVDPDGVPCYIDPFAASTLNRSPVMGVFGEPGSGKTFYAQLVAAQAALAGMNVFFVNPKGFDTLSPWVDWVASLGVPARTVSFSKIEARGGAFDPFTFCTDGRMAAEILTRHIQTVLGKALTPQQDFSLAADLRAGADAGAKCAYEALRYVEDPDLAKLIHQAVESNSLFALAFSREPRDDWDNSQGLTLIEFDRELPLPAPGKQDLEMSERMALAALRITSRAAMEILMRHKGGVYVVDESHHYLASSEGMSSLERLAREGRSMGILPIFITQQPSDLLNVDMETYLSRVAVMRLRDANEARAGLQLCGLKPTQRRLDYLRGCGPQPQTEDSPGRPASGFMRDIHDQHAVVTVGPVPEEMRVEMSTNRTDRQKREEREQVQQEGVQ